MKKLTRIFWQIALLALATNRATAGLEINSNHADATYALGEKITWSIVANDDPESKTEEVRYKIMQDGGQTLREGILHLKDHAGEISIILEQPGVVLVDLNATEKDKPKQHAVGGAIVEPNKIPRSSTKPADFDEFWSTKLAELAKVPTNAQLTPGKSDKKDVSHWLITMDLPRGQQMHAQLARPEKGNKFPALIIFQYAGVYALPPGKVTSQASRGWLTMNVSAHDLPIDEPEPFYTNQNSGPLKSYPMIGNQDRETSYFLRMFLACSRAVDYMASRPDWDGKTLVVTGNSQGGLQSLVAAGLNSKVTALIVNVPAGCDTTAPLAGRSAPWPYWYKNTTDQNRDAIMRTSSYFDAQNFASNIKCQALISFGLIDRTATASGVSVMAAQLGGPVEKLVMTKAEHQEKNGSHSAFASRSGAWFSSLLTTGRPPEPAPQVNKPNPVPN